MASESRGGRRREPLIDCDVHNALPSDDALQPYMPDEWRERRDALGYLPLEFRQIQTATLIGWTGDTDDPEFVRLLGSLERFIGREVQPVQSVPPNLQIKVPDQASEARSCPNRWRAVWST